MFAKSETPEESRSVASSETVSIKYPSQTHPISLSPFKCFQITSLFRSFKDFIYLFLDRGEGREKKKRNIDWFPLTAPNWGPALQSRYIPWLGIKPVTFQFKGQHSIHWATPARAISFFLFRPSYLSCWGRHGWGQISDVTSGEEKETYNMELTLGNLTARVGRHSPKWLL